MWVVDIMREYGTQDVGTPQYENKACTNEQQTASLYHLFLFVRKIIHFLRCVQYLKWVILYLFYEINTHL